MENSVFKKVTYVTINAEQAGQRIDNFLFTRLKNLPKTRVYRILRKGEVRVNKKRIEPSYRLEEGDEIRLPPMRLEEKGQIIPGQRSIDMLTDRILFENQYLLIINKPAGIPVHGGTQASMGVIETLRAMYPKLPHLELAHRLDKDTSGCLILAKKRSTLKELHELMRTGAVNKIYLALTKGHWQPNDFRVDAPLRKNHLSSGERIVKVDPTGKTALTEFEPVEKFPNCMLVKAILHTGRTHQIRVHARHKHHPLAGDEKYGDKEFNRQMRDLGVKRLFLHAHSLEFTLPSNGEKIKVNAPLAADLEASLQALKKLAD